ncbi:MAG TPA: substrate-binding domain-containing protein [Chitinispirillaceae bacterium]|nr:substrate-binding domain-containing protein [Chitinispirillaceae bacterium]
MVTIKDIAEQSGFSIGTVDRVLHGRGRVSKKTEDKIKEIVRATGYKANILARNLSMSSIHNFGVIMPYPYQDSGYWEILCRGIDQAENDLSTFNIHKHYFFFDKYSENSFISSCQKAIDQQMCGLLIAPVLFDACSTFVKSIDTSIPYVYVDSTIPDTTPLAYIGQDSFKSGVCSAKLMKVLLGGKGNVAVLRMLPNDFHINERVRGFTSTFRGDSSVHLHTFDLDGGLIDNAFEKRVREIAEQVYQCNGFFITNAETHRVAKALDGAAPGKHIIGYDCVKENVRLLKDGAIDFIISQNAREQGYTGINTLFRHIVLKELCDANVHIPIDIVIAENCIFYQ